MSFERRMRRQGNAIGRWVHHAFKGRLDAFGDQAVLMVTSPGRRTGKPRSTMVRYLDHHGGYLVWGTGSGSPTDPDWFRNLRATTRAVVEIGTMPEEVIPRELLGTERDRVWREVVLVRAPGVAKYEAKAGRVIPVAHLRPASSPGRSRPS
ncbi:nitroreductase family deazaflavin-dependent oxidoreductase [Georgenia yuyongxinii]|uniref:Nitroreductase family deazaflavin-dependent oxidoreductase n=1 Tax=Georgenia yuyongxinii TaxID=2589797 RepID=A0A5B8C2B3_9MICO|nr:nitroreductase family deazaflavin-dependent oxidoreductase [Georgenia yuyongxinii]QDC23345.1 nitroreductase family deazaflavin-dependent oxidoreductase [Georgenia yuyongxinii]